MDPQDQVKIKIKPGTKNIFQTDLTLVDIADELQRLEKNITQISGNANAQYEEAQKIHEITSRFNAGFMLDDVMEGIYEDFHEFIPYDRIGLALIEEDGDTVRARWAKSNQPHVELQIGYTDTLEGSSLEDILKTKEPRIINDLEEYLKHKPGSNSTRLVVEEGLRSSLTCPLIVKGVPVGFLFFSSITPFTYERIHVGTFKRIADQLSLILEKSKLASELAKQKHELEKKNQELKQLDELKNRLLGMAAHDMRNPILYNEWVSDHLLQKGNSISEEDKKMFLTDINEQAKYMTQLLNDLLEFTSIQSGEIHLQTTAFDMGHFLEEVVQRHNKLAEYKNSKVVLDTLPEGRVKADPLRTRQIMDNLISNAVKYAPSGSTAHIKAMRDGHDWRIEVHDNGPGISSTDQQKLFHDFVKLSIQPTANETSTGLGLAITKRMVEAQGGQIGVASEVSHGSVFWFTLPITEETNPNPAS